MVGGLRIRQATGHCGLRKLSLNAINCTIIVFGGSNWMNMRSIMTLLIRVNSESYIMFLGFTSWLNLFSEDLISYLPT